MATNLDILYGKIESLDDVLKYARDLQAAGRTNITIREFMDEYFFPRHKEYWEEFQFQYKKEKNHVDPDTIGTAVYVASDHEFKPEKVSSSTNPRCIICNRFGFEHL